MESHDALKARALQWWFGSITPLVPTCLKLDSSDRRPVHALVVGHGAFIRMLIVALMDHVQDILSVEPGTRVGQCFNTGVTTIHLESPSRGTLVRYGDITHISKRAPKVAEGSEVQPLKVNVDDTVASA